MVEKAKAPAIRFKGFTDAWEQRELNYFLEVSTEKNTDDLYSKQDVLSVSGDYGIVNQIEFQGRSFAGASVSNYGVVGTGDVVYTKSPLNSNPFGIIKTNKGKTGIVSTLYAVYHPTKYAFPDFVQNYFEQDARVNNYLRPLVNKGAKNDMKVSAENALKGLVMFPKHKEQEAISKLISKLDDLITLHQRKFEKLHNVKKAMLEKMFPKNGNSVPEIRFAGYTDAWELPKVGELTNVASAARVHKEEWTSSGIPFFRSSDVVSAYKGAKNEKAFISCELYEQLARVSGKLEKDDILITGGGSIGIPYIVPNNKPLYSKDADLIWVKRSDKFNSRYMYTYFSSPEFRRYLKSVSHIGTIAHYTIEQVKETPICLPSIDEQNEIGSYFTHLDNLITLHQRKLEKLQNVKKACLEKMFV